MLRTFAALAGVAALAAAGFVMARGSAFALLTVRAEVRPSALVKLEVKTPEAAAINTQDILQGLTLNAGGLKPQVVLDVWPLAGRAAAIHRLSIDF
ncbi:MAG TPA: hypothetical protein VGJ74_14600 [Burkholderiales bacterium]|jgi:hypothetical protein